MIITKNGGPMPLYNFLAMGKYGKSHPKCDLFMPTVVGLLPFCVSKILN